MAIEAGTVTRLDPGTGKLTKVKTERFGRGRRYRVRYIDPDRDKAPRKKDEQGFFDKLKFWKTDEKSSQPQYRIHVADAGASMSQVVVQDDKGVADQSTTGKRIITLLYEQLK